MTKGKNKKIKTTKIYLLLLPPLPSLDGGGVLPPHPPTFFTAKTFEFFSIDKWVSGRRVGKCQKECMVMYGSMAILAKTQKRHEGKSEMGGGGLLPERGG